MPTSASAEVSLRILMSVPKKAVELSPDARTDFTDILMYTLSHWGAQQRDRYEAALVRVIAALGDFPEMGTRRDNLVPGYRSQPVEHHVIYYRIKGDVVEVVRILHERVDAARWLRP